ncbi:MAG: hypothetical protein KIT19_14640 [Phycisphaeraceae bacterium]|nr:hypothetical protein [Phycisphaeraceae bacterium]
MNKQTRPFISLARYSDRKSGDLVFTFWNGDEFACDSYYLCIDLAYEARWKNEPWPEFQRLIVRDLLVQWRNHIGALPDGDAITLPFDLSDQCSTFLRCRREGDVAFLSIIGSLFEGWGVRVSDISDVIRDPAVLRGVQIPAEHAALLSDLVADLDSIIASLA